MHGKPKQLITYRIPLSGLKFSTNKIYAGTHWTKRKAIKDGFHSLAIALCRPAIIITSYPVEIAYTFFFYTRALDTLNCATMAKMLEDSFRAMGILADDDPSHVARSTIEVIAEKKHQKEEDYLLVTISPYERE